MAYKNEIPSENLNRLNIENENIKKFLTEEYGASFLENSDENDLPPEVENNFLNHVLAYEKGLSTAELVCIHDFVGGPIFQIAENLDDEEITIELARLIKLLNDSMISVDTLCEVPERELYRFITEELMFEDIDDLHIPGMVTHFTYEEFHPNHKYDIENHSTEFFDSYLNLNNNYYLNLLTTEAERSVWHSHFRESFCQFRLDDFSIIDLKFDSENAIVLFDCDFLGRIEGVVQSLRYVGAGEIKLLYQNEYWCIDSIKLPTNTICDLVL